MCHDRQRQIMSWARETWPEAPVLPNLHQRWNLCSHFAWGQPHCGMDHPGIKAISSTVMIPPACVLLQYHSFHNDSRPTSMISELPLDNYHYRTVTDFHVFGIQYRLLTSREKLHTPPPSPPFLAKRHFSGEGVGVYILRPHAAGILYAPPPLYAPRP